MFYYKKDVLGELKKEGYSTAKIRIDKILGESYLQKMRNGEMISWAALDKICGILNCQPGDLIGHTSDDTPPEDN